APRIVCHRVLRTLLYWRHSARGSGGETRDHATELTSMACRGYDVMAARVLTIGNASRGAPGTRGTKPAAQTRTQIAGIDVECTADLLEGKGRNGCDREDPMLGLTAQAHHASRAAEIHRTFDPVLQHRQEKALHWRQVGLGRVEILRRQNYFRRRQIKQRRSSW